MAFIGLKIPAEIAEVLSRVEVPGERLLPEDMHITLIHLGKDIPIPNILKTTLATYLISSRWAKFPIGTCIVTSFPKGNDGVPIIARIISPQLHLLQAALRKSLDHMKIEYSKKWPIFKPHTTLSYSETPNLDIKIPALSWEATEMTIWGADQGQGRIAINLPFE